MRVRTPTADERARLDSALDLLLRSSPRERERVFRELTGEGIVPKNRLGGTDRGGGASDGEVSSPTAPDSAAPDSTSAGGFDFAAELRALLAFEERGAEVLGESAMDFARDLIIEAIAPEDAEEDGVPFGDANAATDATVTTEDAARAGRSIGPYRLLSELGRGGMGRVFLAEPTDPDLRRRLALKIVRRGMDTDDLLRRFRRERRILASLTHPGIAGLVDGGATDDGRPYLVMEYVEGKPLDRWVSEHRPALRERVDLFARVADAVAYAHRKLVIHRDLKPSNLLVTAAGAPRLLDFGIAKLLAEDPDFEGPGDPMTREGRRILTPEWASPEQIAGDALSTASDVYQLGLLLRKLLVDEGERLPKDLRLVVGKALEEDPARRYPSAGELATDLRHFLASRPVSARAPSASYRLHRFIARNPVPVAAAAIVVAMGTLFAVAHTRGIAAERDLARVEAERARASVDFVTALFEGADPARAAGDTLNVFEVLDRGMERLGDRLFAQPALREEFEGVLGRIYTELGAFDRAEILLAGASESLTMHQLPHLAALRSRQGRYAEAEELLARLERELGPSTRRASPDARERELRILIQRGGNLGYAGNVPEAERMLRDAFDRIEQDPEAFGHLLSDLRMRLGVLLLNDGRLTEAEALLRAEIDDRRAAGGDRSPALADALNNLGNLLQRDRRPDEAEAAHLEALAIRRVIFAPDHPDISLSLNNLGTVAFLQGRHDDAERWTEEAIAVLEARVGRENRNVAISILNLGWIQLPRDRPDLAERHTREALGILTRVTGPDSPDTGLAWGNLAQALLDQGRLEEAEEAGLEALRIRRVAHGAESMHAAWRSDQLGIITSRAGRPDDAEAYFTESLRIRRLHFPDSHREVMNGVQRLGDFLLQRGRWEDGACVFAASITRIEEEEDAENHQEVVALYRERIEDARRSAGEDGEPAPVCDGTVRS